MVTIAEVQFRHAYWLTVKKCLMRFHNLPKQEAERCIARYRREFPVKSDDPEVDLIYHYEPFRMACDITGKHLSVANFASEYTKLLNEAKEQHSEAVPKKAVASKSTAKKGSIRQSR